MPEPAWWEYEQLESRAPYDWSPASRGDGPWDSLDFHLDLGCGTVPKARIGLDHHLHPNVDLALDLETGEPVRYVMGKDDPACEPIAMRTWELCHEHPGRVLPFPDDSIESIITHHCLEHIFQGFIPLMDECHRVLKPGGFMRIIVPLFPSYAAVQDPDHKRYFMEGVFETFCGTAEGEHWMESFSVPYTSARFQMVSEDRTPPVAIEDAWKKDIDVREMRVMLRKWPRP